MIRSGGWRRLAVLLIASISATARAADDDAGIALFEAKIRPVLIKECYSCHAAGAKSIKGGLRLDSREAVRAGGESGPILAPGKPEESLLVDMVSGDAPEMPQKDKPLSKEQVESLRRWIEQGAHWPEGLVLRAWRDGRVQVLARVPAPPA